MDPAVPSVGSTGICIQYEYEYEAVYCMTIYILKQNICLHTHTIHTNTCLRYGYMYIFAYLTFLYTS